MTPLLPAPTQLGEATLVPAAVLRQLLVMLWRCILLGMAIGVVVEIVARLLRLWLFRHWSLAAINVVLLYGLAMGFLASRWRSGNGLIIFSVAAGIGLAGELANLQFLHFWRFPDSREDSSGARAATVVVLSLLWGIVPFGIAQADASLQRNLLFAVPVNPLEGLNQREAALVEKQKGLQQRLHDVENRLRAIRVRKERLQHKHEVVAPGERQSDESEDVE